MVKQISELSPGLFFSETETTLSGSVVSGYVLTEQDGMTLKSALAWSMVFIEGEVLYSTTPSSFGTISSYGRVTGDKSTLYKYLNPHLVVYTTLNTQRSQAKIYIVDTISGKQIYTAVIRDVVTEKGVRVTMTENWLVYSWLDQSGWRIGSTELYEDRSSKKAET